ncbi:receptor like protein 29-like [Phragmites australis]|uniref:receptor like protein 29-like n=1 Tax=Phragmites australis TaxID=29695 RepID=UPI002D78DF84|nr:receptor like protein 29-like [Phragmites australis]
MASSVFSMSISLVLLLQAAAVPTAQLGAGDAPAPELPRSELAAIFRVMADLLGDPTWPQLHPRPCTDTPWPGLQCELAPDDARRLRATRLHFGPDVSTPPCRPGARLDAASLRGLPHLKTLSLFGCFATGGQDQAVELPPALFANASSLEQIVLKSNPGLTGPIPATLSSQRSLRVLSLSQNGFHGGIPRELGGLAALQQLDLSYNNITGEIPEEIGGMASLTILDLSWNRIDGGVPATLGKLQKLQKADLSYNRLGSSVPPEVGSLRELVFLDLSHNGLAGPLPASLARLGKLQYLLLQDNPLGTAVPAVVGSLRRLQVLGLSGCNLTGPIPRGAFFAALDSLTALSLDRNRLDGPIPASLAALPHLGQLNLSQNRLAGEIALPGEFVARLGRRLDVRGNDELCLGRGLQGSGYLGAPPCVDGDASPARAVGSGAAAAGVGMACHLLVVLLLGFRL